MLRVETPAGNSSERQYIFRVLLERFLAINYELSQTDRSDIRITCPGVMGEIILPDTFFQMAEANWLAPESMPVYPLQVWDSKKLGLGISLKNHELPVIYGDVDFTVKNESEAIKLPIDIFGSAFFMLTRYEEVVSCEKDALGRMPLSISTSARSECLHRPLVDEYVDLLRCSINKLWPKLQGKELDRPCLYLTHDVDTPFNHLFAGAGVAFRRFAGDILKRRSFKLAVRRFRQWSSVNDGRLSDDPYNTFDWIMDRSEEYGITSIFYFMAGKTNHKFDGDYDLAHPVIRKLLRRIHDRGHEIGLHPSFETYRDFSAMKREYDYLRKICLEEGIEQNEWGARQHYLRFDPLITPAILDKIGLLHDSTLGYADSTGFRCGTSREYPLFDLSASKQLNVLERPLIVMDQSLVNLTGMDSEYSGEDLRKVIELQKNCVKYGGNLTLLWHNSSLVTQVEKSFYLNMLSTISSKKHV